MTRFNELTMRQWSFDAGLADFNAFWVNEEEAYVSTSVVSTQGFLALTGNSTAFIELYGGDVVYLALAETYNEPGANDDGLSTSS